MVSKEVIIKRLSVLEEAVKRLSSISKIPLEEFLENWLYHSAALREFQVAIEACMDIGQHLISEMGWEMPRAYKEIPEILARHKVIPPEFAETLKKMISFRNLIVHEYVLIDLKLVYKNLENVKDFQKFAQFIEEFLFKN